MPNLGPYDKGAERVDRVYAMALIFSVVARDLALNGCTKCGPIRDD